MSAVIQKLNIKNSGISDEQAKEAVRTLLRYVGENPEREGLKQTPNRVIKSFKELYAGYDQNAEEVLSKTFEDILEYNEFVLLKDINFTSTCEHHMLPFVGKVHVAYIPNKKVVGISKLARVVEVFAKRLQIQENMTVQIAEAIHSALDAKGVAVVMEAKHFCMSMRGVKNANSSMYTSHFTGVFNENDKVLNRFLNSI
jgi:GTP cyclohydrolase I